MSSAAASIYLAEVQVTGLRVLPLLASAQDDPYGYPDGPVLDDFVGGLAVAYSLGPPYGRRLVPWNDLERLGLSHQMLRRRAYETLDEMLDAVRVHGQPPALMLSFSGLESSLLLADQIWDDLASAVPGELVIGVPARDVVIVTGSRSPRGLEKVRRAVDRMFFAGQRHLLTRHLLVRRDRGWQVFGSRPTRWPASAPPSRERPGPGRAGALSRRV